MSECAHQWTERGLVDRTREFVWYECWACGAMRDAHQCGYLEDSFPCRVRHQSVHVGWGRAQHS